MNSPAKAGPPIGLVVALPLVLLAAVVAYLKVADPGSVLRGDSPPVEEVAITRVVLEPGVITLHAINDGPDPLTVAQVLVDEAYRTHTVLPAREIPPLGGMTVIIPYPWVEGEAHEVGLVTSTGLVFGHEIGVATATPRPTPESLWHLALLGILVGVAPVYLGMLWFPALRRASPIWRDFFLFLTLGLLVLLGIDAMEDALEAGHLLPSSWHPTTLVWLGVLASAIAISALGGLAAKGAGDQAQGLAMRIATGIGLHNLGEGLAIGGAFALGEFGLGALLAIGFALHNATEGLAIVVPLVGAKPTLAALVRLGAIAGMPTILGTWLGAYTGSPLWGLIFLALGAGAIFQVVGQIGIGLARQRGGWAALATRVNAAGFLVGAALIYATSRLVAG